MSHDEEFFSNAQAISKGIGYLTSEERIKTLSKIPSVAELNQISLMYSMAQLFPFLEIHANILLQLFVSDSKASGRVLLTEILKAQQQEERDASTSKRLLNFVRRD